VDQESDIYYKSKAKDINGLESNWRRLSVKVPRSIAIDNPFFRFFEEHPFLFKIFQLLFKQM
jgi:hypothetical protein